MAGPFSEIKVQHHKLTWSENSEAFKNFRSIICIFCRNYETCLLISSKGDWLFRLCAFSQVLRIPTTQFTHSYKSSQKEGSVYLANLHLFTRLGSCLYNDILSNWALWSSNCMILMVENNYQDTFQHRHWMANRTLCPGLFSYLCHINNSFNHLTESC